MPAFSNRLREVTEVVRTHGGGADDEGSEVREGGDCDGHACVPESAPDPFFHLLTTLLQDREAYAIPEPAIDTPTSFPIRPLPRAPCCLTYTHCPNSLSHTGAHKAAMLLPYAPYYDNGNLEVNGNSVHTYSGATLLRRRVLLLCVLR